jgi:glycosyltransferase involved in cell wall biosynthesis
LNQSALDSIREFGFTGPVYIVPNGRVLAHYSGCQYANNGSEIKTLAFIGFLNKRKNQSYLLKVLRELPENYKLRLVGKPLNQEYKDRLLDYIDKHDLGNVEFVGQITHDEIPAFLEKAHVFTSASKMEVQSLVVIEALASGTPVVGLSNETIDELINNEVGAWIQKDQKPADFAQQIERICGLPLVEYELMCQAARDSVAHLDWSHVIESTVSAYEDLQKIQPSISDDESDMLTSLVTFLSMGDVRDYLLDVIDGTRQRSTTEANLLPRMKVPPSIRHWIRVPSSTWILSGLTILVSAIGYLFMRKQGKNKD